MVLLKICTLTTVFDAKYKTSYGICDWLLDKGFGIEDNTGKDICTFIKHSQLLHANDQVVTQLSDMTSFGQMTKYIKHPKSMPNLQPMETKDKLRW